VLSGFKIGIYFLNTDVGLTQRAESLQLMLKRSGVPAEVQLYPEPRDFLSRLPIPRADEVRYEDVYEAAQGEALLTILKTIDPSHTYRSRIVQNRTPNFITIFLKASPSVP
jgi:hypothetical protein